MRLFRLLSWPYLRRHVLRWTLTLSGIVLGVAVFIAMNTANPIFTPSIRRLTRSPARPSCRSRPENSVRGVDARTRPAVPAGVAVPVIESIGTRRTRAKGVMLLGIDMTGDRSLRNHALEDAGVRHRRPAGISRSAGFADGHHRLRLAPRPTVGRSITLRTIQGDRPFTVRGIISGLSRHSANRW
jgi:hypothetical protein